MSVSLLLQFNGVTFVTEFRTSKDSQLYSPSGLSAPSQHTRAEFHSVCLSVQDTKQVLQGGRERSMEPIEPPPLHDTLQNYTRSPIV